MRVPELATAIGKNVEMKTRVGKTYKGKIESVDGDIVTLIKEDGKKIMMTCGLISLIEEI